MPSIFNHENSCWGVKKSFSNLLQCDFDDDLQTSKVGVVSNNLPDSSNSVNYSVSSNGYYGFQPHSSGQNQCQPCDNNAMDIDINNIPAGNFLQGSQGSNPFLLTPSPHVIQSRMSRKRQISVDFIESNKRMRQQGKDNVGPILP